MKHWRDRGKAGEEVSGRIINTASESGLFGQAGQINYSTAKAGIVGMTLVLAREMKKYGVTANVVCPRALTRMTDSVPGAAEYMSGPEWDPEQIAPMVVLPRERRRGRRVGPGVRRLGHARAPACRAGSSRRRSTAARAGGRRRS